MAIGRRGVVFTIMAIFVVVLVLAANRALMTPLTTYAADTAAAASRVSLMNSYSRTFEQHAQRSLATAGYFTLRNMSWRVRTDHDFFDDPWNGLNTTVARCIVDGTLNVSGTLVECLPLAYRLNASLDTLASLASSELAITTSYAINNVTVTETRPLEVIFTLNISYNVSDAFATWEFDGITLDVPVDVAGIADPVYEYMSYPLSPVTNERRNFSLTTIRRTQLNRTMFLSFYGNRSYLFLGNRSPSVLQRYAGETTAVSSCCGVESVIARSDIVNPLQGGGKYVNYSMTDHQFVSHIRGMLPIFDCASTAKGIDVQGRVLVLDEWRFDTVYNLTGSSVGACVFY